MAPSSREYLDKHGVQEKLAKAVAQVLKLRPDDPVKFIGQMLLDTPATDEELMLSEIAKMTGPEGFDYLIVCCSNLAAENYWQQRLEGTVVEVTGTKAAVLCVHEDWNGGAGNGLGTLYAFQKACAKAKTMGLDISAAMESGASVALYHTAGKGTRMAPLPGAENNNKPGVKLPSMLTLGGDKVPITVLECVMRQTSSYAAMRKGRCSVFWGDQIFVPSCGVQPSSMPADILAALRPMPTKQEWEAEELHQYGLIAVDPSGSATQLEKVTYDVATAYLPPDVQQVGTSLGSFSLSAKLMSALLTEFAVELAGKTASLDSDPHFWMPLTLKEDDYVAVMSKKKTPEAEARAHYARMAAFRASFDPSGQAILGCVDVGAKAYWWDYGRLGLYLENNTLLTQGGASADALRTFLGIKQRQQLSTVAAGAQVDPSAVMLKCKIGGGRVGPGSVLVNVEAPSVDVEGCILVNVTSAAPITGKNGLLYNVVHEEAGALEASEVRADVFGPGGDHMVMLSAPDIDGGTAWKEVVKGNPMSFEGVYKKNLELDVGECTAIAAAAHASARAKLA
mmetsp:Transcript_64965/g.128427  ORF Transcript_64965/g.128427 Transcript_64965/m.128427 type:complete len:565 (-) Transcript_64965:479-2173(-)|eukprot:CAMPEP_0174720830 /NCGR_PEP_ID=MMETSP1094-20130205/34603_1 /TAXON_ID=156173 /ORGANISM="Chrysochromulina brevifilum, Strain UTEX LB 985" /LENGTH=564 /DNA_ID=CAMNT_0015921399 /DNA_START=59 /DNA_END=1753 /DNA_ORIENTATION=+